MSERRERGDSVDILNAYGGVEDQITNTKPPIAKGKTPDKPRSRTSSNDVHGNHHESGERRERLPSVEILDSFGGIDGDDEGASLRPPRDKKPRSRTSSRDVQTVGSSEKPRSRTTSRDLLNHYGGLEDSEEEVMNGIKISRIPHGKESSQPRSRTSSRDILNKYAGLEESEEEIANSTKTSNKTSKSSHANVIPPPQPRSRTSSRDILNHYGGLDGDGSEEEDNKKATNPATKENSKPRSRTTSVDILNAFGGISESEGESR
jgi:hypothetical protein